MNVIEKYVSFMEQIAADQSHGYSQQDRWGPNYDCSSLLIEALERVGIPAKSKGATYTGNLPDVLKSCGFKNVAGKVNLSTGDGLKRGDILMYHKQGNVGHVAVCQGGGKIVHARGQSYGSAASGDQGSEIASGCAYYNPGWQYVFRYGGQESTAATPPVSAKNYAGTCSIQGAAELVMGSYGSQVGTVQLLLNAKGFKGKDGKKLDVDGEYGENTAYAVEQLQRKYSMQGIWFGTVSSKTWRLLIE